MTRPITTARATRTRSAIPALAFSTVVFAACGAGDRDAPGPVVRDSAGITIVENTAPLWHENAAWSIDAEPEVEIGVLDGDPAYQLYHARDAARLSDGRIVVANYGTGELRYFDAHGRRMADSTLVRLEADRSLDNVQTGPRRRPMKIVLHSPAGHALDTIAQLPGGESYALMERSENRVAISVYELPFGRSQSVAVADDRIAVSTGERYEITVLAPDSATRRLIRRAVPDRPVTAADIKAYKEAKLAGIADDDHRRRIQRVLADAPFPETMPHIDAILVDAGGRLWGRDYAPPAERDTTPQRWAVFDVDGRWLGTVATPTGLKIHESRPTIVAAARKKS